jgi:hypothetical protein
MSVRHRLDSKGPGSYSEILEYIETAIRENCVMREDAMITAVTEDKETRLARAMLTSILARMDVENGASLEDDEDEGEEHDFQWGEDHVQRCVKCTLPHAQWAGGPCPGSDHPLRPGEYV